MKLLKLTITFIFLLTANTLKAEVPYILNFNFVLNESTAGKKLKHFKQIETGLKKLKTKKLKFKTRRKNY